MAKPGPKPTPKEILANRGSWRAKKKAKPKLSITKFEQGEPEGRPDIPQWVKGEALKEWNWICGRLENMGILAEVDRTMLELYVKAYLEWREADKLVKSLLVKTNQKTTTKADGTIELSGGNIIQHPALSIRNNAWERLKKVCAEFGMSPSARSGLQITTKQPAANSKSRFFTRRKGNDAS